MIRKQAFDPITLGIGMLAAHVGGNVALKTALKSNAGKRTLGRFIQANAELASKGRAIHPSIRGVMDVLMGPEVSHLGHAGAEAAKHLPPQLHGAAKAALGDVAGKSGRMERFLHRTSVPANANKANAVRYAAGYGAALPTMALPGVGHFTMWNAGKAAFFNNPLAKKLGLGRRIAVNTVKQGLVDKGLKAKAKSALYTYGASPVQGAMYDAARAAQTHIPRNQMSRVSAFLDSAGKAKTKAKLKFNPAAGAPTAPAGPVASPLAQQVKSPLSNVRF